MFCFLYGYQCNPQTGNYIIDQLKRAKEQRKVENDLFVSFPPLVDLTAGGKNNLWRK
jgi:hypothetical protein